MSIALSSNLSPIVTELPGRMEVAQKQKAFLYSLASKVCLAAFIAIAGAAIAISLGVMIPIHPALFFALFLTSLPLQFGFQSYMMKAAECSSKAKIAGEKALILASLQNWGAPQIEAFFKEHRLEMKNLPLTALQKIDPEEPLRALLPAIATFLYLQTEVKKLLGEHQKNLHNSQTNTAVRLESQRIGWKILEFQALPRAIEAAFVLETIGNPASGQKLSDLGTFRAKEFDRRRFDQLLDGDDTYFVFNDGRTLTFSELQKSISDLDKVRLKMFSESKQSLFARLLSPLLSR